VEGEKKERRFADGGCAVTAQYVMEFWCIISLLVLHVKSKHEDRCDESTEKWDPDLQHEPSTCVVLSIFSTDSLNAAARK
jgi:hypothetical protein